MGFVITTCLSLFDLAFVLFVSQHQQLSKALMPYESEEEEDD